MKKLFLVPLFIFISRNATAGICEFEFENTVADFCDIIQSGNIDCLKNFVEKNKNVILIVNELHFEYFCKYFVSLINKPR